VIDDELIARAPSNDAAPALPLDAAHARWALTPRQAHVLELVARGLTNALVAETLCITESTIERHLTALFDKAGVYNRTALLAKLFELAQRPGRST
jgi:DNA-binding NarL/FixJ family response regulator